MDTYIYIYIYLVGKENIITYNTMKKKKSSYLDGYIGAEKEARREVKAKAEESW